MPFPDSFGQAPQIQVDADGKVTNADEINRYLLEDYYLRYGNQQSGGILDRDNVADEVATTDEAMTVTQSWSFTAHPTGLDHGQIGGLGDDDHTQYLLASGARDLTGNWTIATKNITLTAGTLTAEQLTSTDDITLAGLLSDTSGIVTVGGIGNTNNETLTLDFETDANKVSVGTTSGVLEIDFGTILVDSGGYKKAGVSGIDNSAAGTPSTMTVSGGIITALSKVTPHADGTYPIAGMTSFTIANGIITGVV